MNSFSECSFRLDPNVTIWRSSTGITLSLRGVVLSLHDRSGGLDEFIAELERGESAKRGDVRTELGEAFQQLVDHGFLLSSHQSPESREYHFASSIGRFVPPTVSLDFDGWQRQLDTWNNRPGFKAEISLPETANTPMLCSLLKRRKSSREFSGEPISVGELAAMLGAAYGRIEGGSGRYSRTTPSPGWAYRLEIYAVSLNVHGLSRGIYQYEPTLHALNRLGETPSPEDLQKAYVGIDVLAPRVSLFLATVLRLEELERKYGARAYRLGLLEAGHVSQNLYLAAAELGLGVVALGGYDDETWSELLALGSQRMTVLTHAVGRAAELP